MFSSESNIALSHCVQMKEFNMLLMRFNCFIQRWCDVLWKLIGRWFLEKKISFWLLMGDPNEKLGRYQSMEWLFTGTWYICCSFNTFKLTGCKESDFFVYWNNFISNVAPDLCRLNRSIRDTDWNPQLVVQCVLAFPSVLSIIKVGYIVLGRLFGPTSTLSWHVRIIHKLWLCGEAFLRERQPCSKRSGTLKSIQQICKIIFWHNWFHSNKGSQL